MGELADAVRGQGGVRSHIFNLTTFDFFGQVSIFNLTTFYFFGEV